MSGEDRRAKVTTVHYTADGAMPNNPDLPVVLMPGALRPGTDPQAIFDLFRANGWGGTWQYTVFDYHHYHDDAHEVLAVASGWADIRLGGPFGDLHRVTAGDAVILPAGTGHCRIDAGDGFSVCGAYPPGQEGPAILRADQPPDAQTIARIAAVPRPETDPIHGASGPLLDAWR